MTVISNDGSRIHFSNFARNDVDIGLAQRIVILIRWSYPFATNAVFWNQFMLQFLVVSFEFLLQVVFAKPFS